MIRQRITFNDVIAYDISIKWKAHLTTPPHGDFMYSDFLITNN